MIIRRKPPRQLGLKEPIRHPDHPLPRTRRDFLRSGLIAGAGYVTAPTFFSLFANPRKAYATLAPDIQQLAQDCGVSTQGAGKIPFICFDLAGGANLNGSEALIGGAGGQLDFLTSAGYANLGLPGDMVPNAPNSASPTHNFINTQLGLAWHSDGAILRGILTRASAGTLAGVNGAVIPALSENDTINNPHNPMYGIYMAGANGSLLMDGASYDPASRTWAMLPSAEGSVRHAPGLAAKPLACANCRASPGSSAQTACHVALVAKVIGTADAAGAVSNGECMMFSSFDRNEGGGSGSIATTMTPR